MSNRHLPQKDRKQKENTTTTTTRIIAEEDENSKMINTTTINIINIIRLFQKCLCEI